MNEREIHEAIYKHICKEISIIAEKIQKNGNMNESDLDRLDKLYHTKKDMLACYGMEHPEEYESVGVSGVRGRSPMTGRYVSRGMSEIDSQSYSDGYNKGYSEAMNISHYPPNYPLERRW